MKAAVHAMEISTEYYSVPLRGDIYLASVGTGKVRPVVILSASRDRVVYLDCTTRAHGYSKQVVLDVPFFGRRTFLSADQAYWGTCSDLVSWVGRVSEHMIDMVDPSGSLVRTAVTKRPDWYRFAYSEGYSS